MKNLKFFYHKNLILANTPKKFLLTILVPFALAFFITFYILSGILVAAMGTRPLRLTDPISLQEGIADSILRLHVIANSDSVEDQEAKLKIKDQVVSYLQSNLLKDVSSKEEVIRILSDHVEDLKQITTQYVNDLGYSYNVEISIGPAYFPVKVYGDITLPAGDYDALRIKLGDAVGQNWWCILFPSLCYVDATYQVVPEESKQQLHVVLSDDEYNSIVSKDETKVVVKFRLWEWFKGLL